MSRNHKTMDRILRGRSDSNLRFAEVRSLLKALGFEERIRGSHFIFSRDGIVEIINLQPKGPNAKPYQVKQIREIITAYGLDLESETSREDHEDEQDQTDSFD